MCVGECVGDFTKAGSRCGIGEKVKGVKQAHILGIAVGVLTFVYLARVRLAQIALERIFENTEFVESRASVDSITPRSLVISDLVLAGEGQWSQAHRS